jgi:hypothetical protein
LLSLPRPLWQALRVRSSATSPRTLATRRRPAAGPRSVVVLDNHGVATPVQCQPSHLPRLAPGRTHPFCVCRPPPNSQSQQSDRSSGTFSLDSESLWLLPFTGQAYFDAELEAWVGLCGNRQRRSWVPVLLGRRACSAAEFTDPPS